MEGENTIVIFNMKKNMIFEFKNRNIEFNSFILPDDGYWYNYFNSKMIHIDDNNILKYKCNEEWDYRSLIFILIQYGLRRSIQALISLPKLEDIYDNLYYLADELQDDKTKNIITKFIRTNIYNNNKIYSSNLFEYIFDYNHTENKKQYNILVKIDDNWYIGKIDDILKYFDKFYTKDLFKDKVNIKNIIVDNSIKEKIYKFIKLYEKYEIKEWYDTLCVILFINSDVYPSNLTIKDVFDLYRRFI